MLRKGTSIVSIGDDMQATNKALAIIANNTYDLVSAIEELTLEVKRLKVVVSNIK